MTTMHFHFILAFILLLHIGLIYLTILIGLIYLTTLIGLIHLTTLIGLIHLTTLIGLIHLTTLIGQIHLTTLIGLIYLTILSSYHHGSFSINPFLDNYTSLLVVCKPCSVFCSFTNTQSESQKSNKNPIFSDKGCMIIVRNAFFQERRC